MNSPPAGTCRERLSFPWPRRTVTGPSRCRITRWVPAAAKDSRYGRSRCTDRYCLSHPRPALVRSGLIHGCRRMPLVSRGPSSLVTRPSLMPLRRRLTPRSFSSVVAGEAVRGPLLPTLGAFGRSSFTREHLVVVTVSLTHVLVEHHAQNERERVTAEQLVGLRVLGDRHGGRPVDPARPTIRRLHLTGRGRARPGWQPGHFRTAFTPLPAWRRGRRRDRVRSGRRARPGLPRPPALPRAGSAWPATPASSPSGCVGSPVARRFRPGCAGGRARSAGQ